MSMSLQEEREWEQEVEDARRAQIESREAKRVKEEADEPAEPTVDDEELALSELSISLASFFQHCALSCAYHDCTGMADTELMGHVAWVLD